MKNRLRILAIRLSEANKAASRLAQNRYLWKQSRYELWRVAGKLDEAESMLREILEREGAV